jgi:hypothetical protein
MHSEGGEAGHIAACAPKKQPIVSWRTRLPNWISFKFSPVPGSYRVGFVFRNSTLRCCNVHSLRDGITDCKRLERRKRAFLTNCHTSTQHEIRRWWRLVCRNLPTTGAALMTQLRAWRSIRLSTCLTPCANHQTSHSTSAVKEKVHGY